MDHAAGSMSSKEVVDIYSTDEPQAALHARVAFCLDIHNEVCRARPLLEDAGFSLRDMPCVDFRSLAQQHAALPPGAFRQCTAQRWAAQLSERVQSCVGLGCLWSAALRQAGPEMGFLCHP